MSSNVTVRVTDVVVRNATHDVVVRSSGPTIVAAGGSGPAGPVWSGNYGSFYGATSQIPAVANVAQTVTFTGTHSASGISLVSSTRITLASVGTYSLTFVANVANYSQNTEHARFWLRLNGSDYPNSTTHADLQPRKSQGVPFVELVTVTFIGTSTAPNDYIEILWIASSTDVHLHSESAGTSPVYPLSPAVIVGVGQIA